MWSSIILAGCGQGITSPTPSDWPAVLVQTIPDGAVVLDARTDADFAAGHIPGSAHFHWESVVDYDEDNNWDVRDASTLAAELGAMGVSTDAPVVVVGAGASDWGGDGNLYWALRYLGHPDVSVLNGGWVGWLAADGDVSTGAAIDEPTTFALDLQEHLRMTTADIEAWPNALLDVRSEEEWRLGHIPGALWMEWKTVLDGDYLRSPEAVEQTLSDSGLTDDTVAVYCQRGIRAGHTFMVLEALGYRVGNYVGAWTQWTIDEGAVAIP